MKLDGSLQSMGFLTGCILVCSFSLKPYSFGLYRALGKVHERDMPVCEIVDYTLCAAYMLVK